jgi:hypothetical protein
MLNQLAFSHEHQFYPHNRLLVEKNRPILFNAQKLSPQETEEYIENSNYFKSSDNHINYKKSF